MAAQSTAIPVTGTGVVFTGPCTFRGFAISSTAGADVVLYDGTSASGTILAQFTLAPKGFQPMDINDGQHCSNGIYLSSTAAVQGNVRIG